MKYGLGIDTGGTYTDAVIYDFENDTIISASKSITIKEDLTIGINGAMEQLPSDILGTVAVVSLSTTLATNACVEGKGSRAKLILIGCIPEIAARYGKEYGLPNANEIIFLEGGHNQQGKVTNEPDWDFLKSKVSATMKETDAYAVVELWGTRNADFEKKAKELITYWTGLQVVCGYEINGEPNSLKRAASALLNAQLIPIISNFLDAIKISLKQKGINAPLVIVRGDGSLMSEEFARDKPVETLLCGPAASVAGGIHLTGEKNCVIIDMGGTTSDISIVKNGVPKLTTKGATIGKWRTGIRSILINTVGLGGDSLIRHTGGDKITIGPDRAAPLSWAATRWPSISGKVKAIYDSEKKHSIPLYEFFYLLRDISEDTFYSTEERKISAALKNGPLSITELAEATGISLYEMNLSRLEHYGIVLRCGLTPTDIMHITGAFTGWDRDAAYSGAKILANQINIGLNNLIEMVNETIKEGLYHHIVRMLLDDKNEKLLDGGITKQLDSLLTTSFRESQDSIKHPKKSDSFVGLNFFTNATLVGIGAPIHIYLSDVARALKTTCVIPENAGVANAVGAITGNVMLEESILIKPQYSAAGITGYIGFSPLGNEEFKEHIDAIEWAKAKAYHMAKESALLRGADEVEISVMVDNDIADIASPCTDDAESGAATESVAQILLETIVTASAIGKIKWA